ncbi:MAG: DHH family phosphoesterase [Oscillospiraceae bacterium]|nr:DHH family phosphoesterase [Oscillospiraceae bacterium]
MTIADCAKLLHTKNDYLILTHRNPDGDTVMSAAALCRALRRKNKRAYLYPNPQLTGKQLPFVEKLLAPASFTPGCVLAVDIATESLFPAGFSGAVDLCVDHHPSNSHYAKAEFIDAEKSSCGEIVMELIRQFAGKLTKNEATLLYIALTTDTGAFQYANVNADTFRTASELLQAGADSQAVILRFFRKVTLSRLRLEGMIYSSLHAYHDGKVVVSVVTQEMIRSAEADEDDCDDLAGLPGRAEAAMINITIRELADGSSKISVRSAPGISSCEICAALGGGGHEMAAGCTIPESPDKAERILLDIIDALYGEKL